MNIKPIKVGAVLLSAISVLGGCGRFEGKLFNFALSIERQRSNLTLKTLRIDQQNIAYLEREGRGETESEQGAHGESPARDRCRL